jgi:rRNA maturation endonuclease Nob1
MANNFFDNFNFQNLGKEVQKCVDVVAEKTEEAFNGSKTYVEKVQSTSKLSGLYEKLGKAHYITATGQEDQRKEIANLMEQISDILDDIEEADRKVNKDAFIRCEVCKKKISATSKFCPRCGSKVNVKNGENE